MRDMGAVGHVRGLVPLRMRRGSQGQTHKRLLPEGQKGYNS
jgi:hypothetical protein